MGQVNVSWHFKNQMGQQMITLPACSAGESITWGFHMSHVSRGLLLETPVSGHVMGWKELFGLVSLVTGLHPEFFPSFELSCDCQHC